MKGNSKGCRAWKNYFKHVHTLVYVMDYADKRRWSMDKYYLESLLNNSDMKNLPILVSANKCDDVAQESVV
ncbi:GTP-binding protein SAR1 [Zootermopsis nevadensis]|uniref:small monomeric GTPase n=1 Tax=Zootermopsis nevadensis TaxID=136037 RepID=A0A067R3D8_ZOONE|nr:GTP-binding protein SAR1 [Zootermopsis nevadensis]